MAELEIEYVVDKEDMRKILFGASDNQIKWMNKVQLPYTDVEVQDESKFHPSAFLTSTIFTES